MLALGLTLVTVVVQPGAQQIDARDQADLLDLLDDALVVREREVFMRTVLTIG